MAEPDEQPRTFQISQLPHKKSERYAAVYTNNVGLGNSFYDVQLVFGQVIPGQYGSNPEPYVEDSVAVTMAWEHAKALAIALQQAVESYEKEHGPVRAS